jgi:hypothetical protein
MNPIWGYVHFLRLGKLDYLPISQAWELTASLPAFRERQFQLVFGLRRFAGISGQQNRPESVACSSRSTPNNASALSRGRGRQARLHSGRPALSTPLARPRAPILEPFIQRLLYTSTVLKGYEDARDYVCYENMAGTKVRLEGEFFLSRVSKNGQSHQTWFVFSDLRSSNTCI